MHHTSRLARTLPFVFALSPAGLLLGVEIMEKLVVTAAATLAGGGNLQHLLRFEPNTHVGNAPGPIFDMRGLSQEGFIFRLRDQNNCFIHINFGRWGNTAHGIEQNGQKPSPKRIPTRLPFPARTATSPSASNR